MRVLQVDMVVPVRNEGHLVGELRRGPGYMDVDLSTDLNARIGDHCVRLG
jgi:hypothetical protein